MIFSDFYSSDYFYIVYCALFFYILYKLSTWRFTLDKQIGISGPKPLPLFGNLFDYIKRGFHVCDVEYQKKYGDIYPIYVGQIRMLVVSDEAVLKQVLIKESKSFVDRPDIQGLSKLTKQSVSILKGKDWERVRALLTPIFTTVKLKQMYPTINSAVNDMMERLTKTETVTIEARNVFGSLSMDTIARTMFGIEINLSENNSHAFITHVLKLFSLSTSGVMFTVMSIFPELRYLIDYWLPNGFVSPASEIYLQNSLKKTIAIRRQSLTDYHDCLALMIKAHDELLQENHNNPESLSNDPCYKQLTEEEIMAQSIIFLLAGYETTSMLLTFSAYFLSKNQNIQEDLYEELMEHLRDEEDITYEMLPKLNLLDQCINETLRLCPPLTRYARACTKDIDLTTSTGQTITIKKGVQIMVPVYAIHHDERLWENPEEFDIHRFDKSVKQNRSPFSFLPFGVGPRNCIGLRFALVEAKLALANIIRKYILLPCNQTLGVACFDAIGFIKLTDPIYMRVKKR